MPPPIDLSLFSTEFFASTQSGRSGTPAYTAPEQFDGDIGL